MGTDDSTMPGTSAAMLNFSDSPFVDDDSWAEPPRAADRRLQIAAVALGLGVVALTFFTLGARVGKSRAAATPVAGGLGGLGGRGAGGFGGGAPGGFGGRSRALLPTVGKVTKVDGNTITMLSADGSTVTVNLADDTSIGRRKTQSAKNIAVGDEISVRGATGDDGSITATAATVGDVEPSAIPTGAGTSGGGFGNGTGVGAGAQNPGVSEGGGGATGAVVAVDAPPGAATVAGSPLTADQGSPTTAPSLGGLLPG